jgi:DNA-binding response OmpR family regulator
VHGRDDIAALAEQFNAMLDRLETAFGTRRQFLDDAGHELRTPITIIRGHLEVMGDDPAERAEVTILRNGEVSLDLRTRRAHVPSGTVDLTAREFAVLELFLRHPGQVLSREQILSHVWSYDFDPGSNVVDVYVRTLRRKIGMDVIETVRGMGYRVG